MKFPKITALQAVIAIAVAGLALGVFAFGYGLTMSLAGSHDASAQDATPASAPAASQPAAPPTLSPIEQCRIDVFNMLVAGVVDVENNGSFTGYNSPGFPSLEHLAMRYGLQDQRVVIAHSDIGEVAYAAIQYGATRGIQTARADANRDCASYTGQ